MPLFRSLLVALYITSVASADDVLRTLDNKTISGTLVGITGKDVTMTTSEGDVKTPLDNVIGLDLRPVQGLKAGTSYCDIRLVDETVLLCGKYAIKGKVVEAMLLGGQAVVIPLASVASILRDADDPKLKLGFSKLLTDKAKRDRVVLYKGGEVNHLEGTIGDADAAGSKIRFTPAGGGGLDVPLGNLQGMIFYRTEAAAGATPVCMIYDTSGNAVAATKVVVDGNKASIVTTIPNVTVQWETASIARFDFNMGKLTFLSDLVPTKVVEKSGIGLIVTHQVNQNLDGDPIVLDGRTYGKGLSLHAHTELEFDLKGKFKKFTAILGIDTRIGGESKPKVTIEVDGRVAFNEVITGKSMEVNIDVTKANAIRITVSSQNILDMHDHVTIAIPKVTQ